MMRLEVLRSPTCPTADCFRLILRLYPEAAGFLCKENIEDEDEEPWSAYKLAAKMDSDPYFLRLLLKADPTIDPAELRRLNYEARRMALFLAYRGVSRDIRVSVWVLLRSTSTELLRYAISFL